jgi:hypothetical protein
MAGKVGQVADGHHKELYRELGPVKAGTADRGMFAIVCVVYGSARQELLGASRTVLVMPGRVRQDRFVSSMLDMDKRCKAL